jgi:hypothetical protein
MSCTHYRRIAKAVAIVATALSLASGNAIASWTYIADVDSSDSATNPGYPGNQSPPTIGAYLQDLLNLSSAPHLLGQNDNYGGAILTGIGNPSAPANMFLLAFHFGNGNDYWTHSATFDAFFSCVSACDTFTLPSTKAVSNYRLYSIADGPIGPSIDPQGPAPVPEPASIALLALGLVGLGVSRFRRH